MKTPRAKTSYPIRFVLQHCFIAAAIFLMLPMRVGAQSDYYRHVIFDNSLNKDGYYFSHAQANGSSFIEQQEGRLPVDATTFRTPPNAIRIQWQSAPDWRMERANLHARLPQPAPRPRRPQSLLLYLRRAAHRRRRHAAARPLYFQRGPASCRIPCQFQRSTQPGKIHRRRTRLSMDRSPHPACRHSIRIHLHLPRRISAESQSSTRTARTTFATPLS